MGRASKGRATAGNAPVVILVRPQPRENIGMAARAMLNCGLSSLRLVKPRDSWPNAKAERAASGADVVLTKAGVFEFAADAVADLQRVVATTGRGRDLSQRIVIAARPAMRAWIAAGEVVGILFGPERTGLTNDDLVHADTALDPAQPAILVDERGAGCAAGRLRVAGGGRGHGRGTHVRSRRAAGDQGRAAEPLRPSRTYWTSGLPAEQGDAAGHGAQPARCCSAPA